MSTKHIAIIGNDLFSSILRRKLGDTDNISISTDLKPPTEIKYFIFVGKDFTLKSASLTDYEMVFSAMKNNFLRPDHEVLVEVFMHKSYMNKKNSLPGRMAVLK